MERTQQLPEMLQGTERKEEKYIRVSLPEEMAMTSKQALD